jgi:hypothetical protein
MVIQIHTRGARLRLSKKGSWDLAVLVAHSAPG